MTTQLSITYEGVLLTDGSTVYIGGMDLGQMLARSLPNRPADRKHDYLFVYPNVSIRVEVAHTEEPTS